MTCRAFLLLALVLGVASPARADDVRPATLQVREVAPERFDVRWQTPMRGRSRLRAHPRLPPGAIVTDASRRGEAVGDSWIERFEFTLEGGLLGREMGVTGLAPSSRNAILRVRLLDGTRHHAVLGGRRAISRIEAPAYVPPVPWTTRARDACLDGARHALHHLAHLLLAFLLVLAGGRRAWGFTLALFLAGNVLGASLPFVLPRAPTLADAGVALVAALVARQVVLGRDGTLPVLVALAGLAHGLLLPAAASPGVLGRVAFAIGVDATHLLLGAGALLALRIRPATRRRGLAWPLGILALATSVVAATDVVPRGAEPLPPPLSLDLGGAEPGPAAPASLPGLETDVEVYLDVGVFSTRVEILGRLEAVARWVAVERPAGDDLAVADQATFVAALSRAVEAKLDVALDGVAARPDSRRSAFATQDATGTYLREEATAEHAPTALVGFTFAFRTPAIPGQVQVALVDAPPGLARVRARILDPEVSREVSLAPDDPTLRWINELTEDPLPSIEALKIDGPPRVVSVSLLTILLAGVVGGLALARSGRRALAAGLLRLVLAAAVVAAPLGVVHVSRAAGEEPTPTPVEARRIVRVLLDHVYRAFNVREENSVYEHLAASLTETSRAEAYLQNRRALAVARVGGARTHVDAVELLELDGIEALPGGGFGVRAAWTVAGSVTHFGHRHLRQNLYRARLTVVAVDGTWKIDAFEIEELERSR